jgi:hypothetical protein
VSEFVSQVPSKTVTLPSGKSVVIKKLSGRDWSKANASDEKRHAMLVAGIVSWNLDVKKSEDAISDLDDDVCDAIVKEIQILAKPVYAAFWTAVEENQSKVLSEIETKAIVEESAKND